MPPIGDKQQYLAKLQKAVQQAHGCEATHRRSVTVHETLRGKTLWKGTVEIFWLTGHPKAKRCYVWANASEKGPEKIETVLELPPVIGAATAVRSVLSSRQQTA